MANPLNSSSITNWLIIAVLLLLTLLSVGNFYLLLEGRNSQGIGLPGSVIQTESPTPIFIKLGPLTVNLRNDSFGQRLLYTSLTLRVDNEATRDIVTAHMPEVHSRLLLLLSAQNAEDMTSADGKAILSEKILALFEEPLADPQPPLAISAVLFTDFIVQ